VGKAARRVGFWVGRFARQAALRDGVRVRDSVTHRMVVQHPTLRLRGPGRATQAERERRGGEEGQAGKQYRGGFRYRHYKVLQTWKSFQVHAGERARESAVSIATKIALRRDERSEELV
jgi:hypothetical protein